MVPEAGEAFNLNFHHITRIQEHGRFAKDAHSIRCSGRDDVSGFKQNRGGNEMQSIWG